MGHGIAFADDLASTESVIRRHHFDVQAFAPHEQLLAWRDRVCHVVDVLPSRSNLKQPFSGSIDRYQVGDLMFTDCQSDSLRLERSLTRISRDRNRDFVFHVFLEGSVDDVVTCAQARRSKPTSGKLLVLDLNRPFRMHRHACRMFSLFVPVELLKHTLADPEALHGRIIDDDSPLTSLLIAHLATLAGSIETMTHDDAASAIRDGASMLTAAFGKQAGLHGNARAAARAAMLRQARRYVQAHVHETDLLPEKVCAALSLPRRSLYRLFEHEGGLNAYIRHAKLRCAADELKRYTAIPVAQIAYGLGFKSPSDFTRAFRRSFGMSPQEFRMQSNLPAEDLNALA